MSNILKPPRFLESSMSIKVPLATLRVFEAAARWQSFQAAAKELGLSPSAVSHAVRRMEEALGVPLFERTGRTLRLTALAHQLFTAISGRGEGAADDSQVIRAYRMLNGTD